MSVRVYTSRNESIVLADKPFSSGGEGAVYEVLSSPSRLKNVCVKIYHPGKLTPQREERIKYMVENPPSVIRGDHFMIGWPVDYVTDRSRRFLGFVMPLGFKGSKELVVLTSTRLSNKLGDGWRKRYDRALGKQALLSRLKLICNISIPIHILHSTGKYVLKDFKPQNILVTEDGNVTIVDMDSVQIAQGNKLLFPGTAATPEYIPPEYYKFKIGQKSDHLIHKSWDMFAVGVVYYQLLFGLHPYTVTPRLQQKDGANDISVNISSDLFPFGKNAQQVLVRPKPHDKFNVLPQNLKELFIHTFTEDIGNRPDAETWGRLVHKIVVDAESVSSPPPYIPPYPPEGEDDGKDSRDDDTIPEDARNQINKWYRAAGRGYLLSILSHAFLPNVYRWGDWPYEDREMFRDEPTIWLFFLPIVLSWILQDFRPNDEVLASKSKLLNYCGSSWSYAVPLVLCAVMSAYIYYDFVNSYFYTSSLICALGPMFCVFFWCYAIFCLYKMQRKAKDYLSNT